MHVVREDVPIQDPKFGKLYPCPRCGGEQRQKWLRQFSRLDGELAQVTIKDWITRPGLEGVPDIMRRAVADRTWVTLSGPPGTGKSMWLAMLTNGAIAKGNTAVYTTLADLLADLRATFREGSDVVYSRLYADVTECDVLCLDEIEKVHLTGWAEEQIFRLVEHRFRARGRVMTALATQRDLRYAEVPILRDTKYPNYLESRVRDDTSYLVIDFWSVPDFRSFREAQANEIL